MRTCSRGTVHPCSFAHMMKNVRNDTSRLMSAGRLGPLLEAGHQRASFLTGGRDLGIEQAGAGVLGDLAQIGRAHVRTPVTNAHLVCRLLREQTNYEYTQ